MENPELAERLRHLEAKIAHLEYAYDQLNEVVITQQKTLARLQSDAQRLANSMSTIETDRIHSNTQKPPHYQ
jgi:uncharacterized coiled-coil protein SlyX